MSFIHERDHNGFAPGNHLAIFAALIAVKDLCYADAREALGPTCRTAANTLAKLGMPRWLAVPNLILGRIRLRFGGVKFGFV
jgi:hypothetical protein